MRISDWSSDVCSSDLAVAVAADAGDHAGEEMASLRVVGRSKTERVEVRHRPRAHGEHVAQDAADAGGGAVGGLVEARVVTALHIEADGRAIADVDHAGDLEIGRTQWRERVCIEG